MCEEFDCASPAYINLYSQIVNYVTDYEKRLLSRHGKYIRCIRGCSDCCLLQSVTALEGFMIASAYDKLPEALQRTVVDRTQPLSCPFLHQSECLIYERRPIICRTHGYPILVDGKVDYCPVNFKSSTDDEKGSTLTLHSDDILNLQGINDALCIANKQFLKQSGFIADQFGRTPLASVPALISWSGCGNVFCDIEY